MYLMSLNHRLGNWRIAVNLTAILTVKPATSVQMLWPVLLFEEQIKRADTIAISEWPQKHSCPGRFTLILSEKGRPETRKLGPILNSTSPSKKVFC